MLTYCRYETIRRSVRIQTKCSQQTELEGEREAGKRREKREGGKRETADQEVQSGDVLFVL